MSKTIKFYKIFFFFCFFLSLAVTCSFFFHDWVLTPSSLFNLAWKCPTFLFGQIFLAALKLFYGQSLSHVSRPSAYMYVWFWIVSRICVHLLVQMHHHFQALAGIRLTPILTFLWYFLVFMRIWGCISLSDIRSLVFAWPVPRSFFLNSHTWR